MSTLYLVDAHEPVIENSRIKDTRSAGVEPVNITGAFVVRVPAHTGLVPVPTTLPDLVTRKYAALLRDFAGFTSIVFDDLLDDSGIDPVLSVGALLGSRGAVSLPPTPTVASGPVLYSREMRLGPIAPSQAVVTWEVARLSLENPISGPATRFYLEQSSSELSGEVTFDGSEWLPVFDGALLSIPLSAQGTDFRIRFHNVSGERLWIGSWAIVF